MDEKRSIKANGLELIQLDSRVIPLFPSKPDQNVITFGQLVPTLATYFTTSVYVMAYLYAAVIVGKFENNKFDFYEPGKYNESDILKLRVFNQDQELLVWKSGDVLKARLRKDDFTGSTCEAVVADHVLAGTQTESLGNGWIRISEKRGGVLELPLQHGYVDVEKEPDKRIFIRTYNYITDIRINEAEAYQATYCDCRFAGFTGGAGTNFIV